MAGLGDYKKGKAFTLKSGNKPTFKDMGSSPLSKRDVYIDGENIGTGPEAVKKGIAQEKKNIKVGVGTDKADAARASGNLAEVTYTGSDVRELISRTDPTSKERKRMQDELKDTGELKARGSDRAISSKLSPEEYEERRAKKSVKKRGGDHYYGN